MLVSTPYIKMYSDISYQLSLHFFPISSYLLQSTVAFFANNSSTLLQDVEAAAKKHLEELTTKTANKFVVKQKRLDLNINISVSSNSNSNSKYNNNLAFPLWILIYDNYYANDIIGILRVIRPPKLSSQRASTNTTVLYS